MIVADWADAWASAFLSVLLDNIDEKVKYFYERIWFLKWQRMTAFRKEEKYCMSENDTPPFAMTEEIMNLVMEIGELVGQIDAHNNLSASLTLRRENRIKTIYSSLAIEQNTLTLEQVTDVIDFAELEGVLCMAVYRNDDT